MTKAKTLRKPRERAPRRSATLSLAALEECLLHLNVAVPGLSGLGSGQYKNKAELYHAAWDYIDWSNLFRRLARVRRILDTAYDNAASRKRIAALEDRIDAMPDWRFNDATKRRMGLIGAGRKKGVRRR